MTDAHEASDNAVHKAKSAALAVELAREAQQRELVEQTAAKTKEALIEGLREVFGVGDDPTQMNILVRRIPLICQDVKQIHTDIAAINDNLKWGVRIVIGAVILGVLKLIFIP